MELEDRLEREASAERAKLSHRVSLIEEELSEGEDAPPSIQTNISVA